MQNQIEPYLYCSRDLQQKPNNTNFGSISQLEHETQNDLVTFAKYFFLFKTRNDLVTLYEMTYLHKTWNDFF